MRISPKVSAFAWTTWTILDHPPISAIFAGVKPAFILDRILDYPGPPPAPVQDGPRVVQDTNSQKT